MINEIICFISGHYKNYPLANYSVEPWNCARCKKQINLHVKNLYHELVNRGFTEEQARSFMNCNYLLEAKP